MASKTRSVKGPEPHESFMVLQNCCYRDIGETLPDGNVVEHQLVGLSYYGLDRKHLENGNTKGQEGNPEQPALY